MNALQLCCRQFSHRETLCQTFFKRSPILDGCRPSCVFETPLGREIRDHVLNWTFFARCYGWCTTSEYRFKIGDFAPTGAGWPKISGRRGHPTKHSFFHKTRLNDLLYGIKIWTDLLPFCHNPRVWQTDRRTDRQRDGFLISRPRPHCMQGGKNEHGCDFSSR